MSHPDINIKFKAEDLICSICFDLLNKEIYTCMNSHFICGKCFKLMNKTECPTCKSQQGFSRYIFLEQSIKPHLVKCPNDGCPQMIFKFDRDHAEECIYGNFVCPFCNQNVSNIKLHYSTFCSRRFYIHHDTTLLSTSFRLRELNSPTIYTIVSRYNIIIYPKEHIYIIYIIAINDKYCNKKITISSSNQIGECKINANISIVKKLEQWTFPRMFGNSLIFDEVQEVPVQKQQRSNNSDDLILQLLRALNGNYES